LDKETLKKQILELAKKRPMTLKELRPKLPGEKGGKTLTSSQITREENGWINPRYFRPQEYDLVDIKNGINTLKGWWTGCQWDGYRPINNSKPILWREKHKSE